MALSIAEVVNLGAASIAIGGVDLGHTDDTGAKVSFKNAIVEAKAGKYGDAPVGKWLNGQRVEVEFNLIQTNFVNLEKAIPGAVKVTSGGFSKITFGKTAGVKLTGAELRLSPFPAGNSPAYDLQMKNAVPVGDFEVMYTGNQVQIWKCKFEAVIDEAGGAEGSFLMTFGDPSITPDVTPPTVTAVTPLDAAVAVPVGNSVVWTISEDLDGNTVNSANVKLFADPTGSGPTGLGVSGTVTLINAGAGTTITFDPTAPLAALTKYIAVLEDVKDKNGNLLASGFYATEFTTA